MRFRQKFTVNDNGFRADQVLNTGSTAPGRLVSRLDHFNGAIAANPEIVKRSDPRFKPEAHPFAAKRLSFIGDRSPVVRHQHDVANLPLSQLASMPKAGSIRRFDGANKVKNIQEFQIVTDHPVVLFPVQEKGLPDSRSMCRIRRRVLQKGVPMICHVPKWARHGGFAIAKRQMRENSTGVACTVSPADGHWLFAGRAACANPRCRAEFAPKLNDRDLYVAIRVKSEFHVNAFSKDGIRRNLSGNAWPAQWVRERGQSDAAQLWESYQ